MGRIVGTVLAIPVAVLIALPAAIWQAFVAHILWGWFVTPAFGIEAPAIVHLAGVMLLISMPIARYRRDDGADAKWLLGAIIFSIVMPSSSLLLGWVLHLFA
jgi:hypothetical protein